jgi:periplasmic protein TonB
MGGHAFRNDEKVGLAAAVVLHGALVAVLLLQTVRSEVVMFPERITVSLAPEVGLEAAAPDPVAESRAAIAPTLSDAPAPAPEPARPERAAVTPPTPPPPPPKPRPNTRTPASQPVPPTRDRSRPDRTPPKPAAAPAKATTKGGGSRIGDDFLDGKGSSTATQETRAPAKTYGPSELASLDSAVGRQVKVKWQGRVPQGPDAEKLVTRVRFKLGPDGTLVGEPQIVGNTIGVTDLNRNQVARHREEAVRAVKLVGQFKLPFAVPPDHNTFTLKFERNQP